MAVRQPIISVLGHVDHGKCVHPNTLIPLADGRILSAKEIFEEHAQAGVEKLEEGELTGVGERALWVYSLNSDLKIEPKKVSHVIRLRSPDKLVHVKLAHAHAIKVTPEHPFFVVTDGCEIVQKRASDLKEGDFVVVPRSLLWPDLTLNHLKTAIYHKLTAAKNFVVKVPKSSNEDFYRELEAINKTGLREKGLFTTDPASCIAEERFRLSDFSKLTEYFGIPALDAFEMIDRFKNASPKWRAGHTSPWISLPDSHEDFQKMFYIMGLLYGDGTGGLNEISTRDQAVIDFYRDYVKEVFDIEVAQKSKRTCDSACAAGGKSLQRFINEVFDYPTHEKSKTIVLPELVQIAPRDVASEFIASLFDTDGYLSNHGAVEITTASREFARKLALMLLWYGCPNTLIIKNGYATVRVPPRYILSFFEGIRPKLVRKQISLHEAVSRAANSKTFDMVPVSGRFLRMLGLKAGLSNINNLIPWYNRYERCRVLSRNFLKQFVSVARAVIKFSECNKELMERVLILKYIRANRNATHSELLNNTKIPNLRLCGQLRFLVNNKILLKKKDTYALSRFGKEMLGEWELTLGGNSSVLSSLDRIEKFCNSDVLCVRVNRVKLINSDTEYVYDFTVPETHNFVAEGVIIHNTTLLDSIRGTRVAAREPGLISQHVGASEIPTETIKQICGRLLERFKIELMLPGLLFIDTPGHEAFTNLRRRGGALADLAALVVDINEGFMPQTLESLTILKTYRTPFMLVANKIDLIPGWQPTPKASFLESFARQRPEIQRVLDDKIYELVGKLHGLGFESERFDRVSDFRRQVSIVPTSAKTGEGVPEVLTVLAGLAQRFLERELTVEVKGPARGTVLEVKEEVGLGKTIDVIVYGGTLAKGDLFAVGGLERAITSKVRALLRPKPLDEIRDPEDRFDSVEKVYAAAGVKVAAPNLEGVVAGAPLLVIRDITGAEKLWEEMQQELERIRISADITGVVVKADALGSLEALERQLHGKGIPIRLADIGDVSRRDVIEAVGVSKSDPLLGVVLAFNAKVLPDAQAEAEREGVQILREEIIYRLVERYDEWAKLKREEVRAKRLEGYVRPAKFALKPGYVFRRSHPAIVGVDVLGGVLRPKVPLMRKDGRSVGTVRELQREKKSVPSAKLGDELAVSIEGPMIGRQIQEGDVLYTDVPKDHVLALKRELRDLLSGDELAVLDEIIAIKQREDPTYGVM